MSVATSLVACEENATVRPFAEIAGYSRTKLDRLFVVRDGDLLSRAKAAVPQEHILPAVITVVGDIRRLRGKGDKAS